MTENEMLLEVVDVKENLRQIVTHHDDSRRTKLDDWNVQMYYEAMGFDFEHDDEQ
jgi:hypothetical protein